MHVVYLHGFASSPASSKGEFFATQLARRGRELHRPDFNLPEFSTLTISRMLGQLEAVLDELTPGPVALIGSSLGGFVALHAAAQRGRRASPTPIARLVLLAPAFDFGSDRDTYLGPDDVARWQADGWREVFHYAYERPERVHFGLYQDARRFDSLAVHPSVPTLIFQGLRDEVVNSATVIRFAALEPTVRLRLLDDGHQLKEHMDTMWDETAAFLGLEGLR